MKIAGIQKNSFVDYPGKMAAVVFTPGCNMNCYYCHNRSLICQDKVKGLYHQDVLFNLLEDRRGFLDGVVITGGEPTLQSDLEGFVRSIKELGYPVKLDTNGTRPDVLKNLMDQGLLDYVAMDFKAPVDKYEDICGTRVPTDKIIESIEVLMTGKTDYEFRTTMAPSLVRDDIAKMVQVIRGARLYVLQQFRRPDVNEGFWDKRVLQPPHSPDFIMQLANDAKKFVQKCITRGI